ncbi:MAG: dihydrofolate reductase [Chitinophagaceae bacterium]|nr:MAG: dihydrofolate reductase [Chitinophagaceae bacterium]
MIITLVVAASTNHAIGKNNQLLWRLPNDMKYFKNVTWGMPVIMGRKTLESLGKALPGRKNIVITRNAKAKFENAVTVSNLEDALFVVKQTDAKEAMVIGGGEIYKMAFEKANRIYITRVDAELEGDTYFPAIDPAKWKLVRQKNHDADEKHMYAYSFQVWERI